MGFAETMSADLENHLSGDDISNGKGILGAIASFVPYLRMWAAYISGFAEYSRQTMEAIPKPMLESFEKTRSSIQSILIEPIQRAPRYKLLVEELASADCPPEVTTAAITASDDVAKLVAELNKNVGEYANDLHLFQLAHDFPNGAYLEAHGHEDIERIRKREVVGEQILKPSRHWLASADVQFREANKLGDVIKDCTIHVCNDGMFVDIGKHTTLPAFRRLLRIPFEIIAAVAVKPLYAKTEGDSVSESESVLEISTRNADVYLFKYSDDSSMKSLAMRIETYALPFRKALPKAVTFGRILDVDDGASVDIVIPAIGNV